MTKNTTDYKQSCELRDLGVEQDTMLQQWDDDGSAEKQVAAHTETELREVIVGMGYDVYTTQYESGHTSAVTAPRDHAAYATKQPMIDTLFDLLLQVLEAEKGGRMTDHEYEYQMTPDYSKITKSKRTIADLVEVIEEAREHARADGEKIVDGGIIDAGGAVRDRARLLDVTRELLAKLERQRPVYEAAKKWKGAIENKRGGEDSELSAYWDIVGSLMSAIDNAEQGE